MIPHSSERKQISPAVYSGFFWEEPLSAILEQPPLFKLDPGQIQTIREEIRRTISEATYPGRYPGIPSRTLLLPEDGLRVCYGESMGDEIGLRSLDGTKTMEFYGSIQLVRMLYAMERKRGGKGWIRIVRSFFRHFRGNAPS